MIAEEVFRGAMALVDEFTSTGIDEASVAEYRVKAPYILTMLQAEICGIENRYRSVEEQIFPIAITDLSQPLQIDDIKAYTLLENGLAAELMMSEDKALANFFQDRYEEMKGMFLKPIARKPETREDVYDAKLNY